MKFSLFITGCQYNYYDAKNITQILQKLGYIYIVNEKKADIIIVLACSVRQKPIDRIYGKIQLWKKLPQKPKIIICGCILPNDFKKIRQKVDLITDANKIKNNIEKIIKIKNPKNIVKNINVDRIPYFTQRGEKRNTAYIPIMQGCDNFCTYCAVPYTRGREISRNQKDVLDEIKTELKNEKKHIILLGQNVCNYQIKINKKSFSKLLQKIDSLNYNFDFNFYSANPRNFTDELINTLSHLKKWQRILHLPMQSGSDEILKKMNRKYNVQDYLRLVESIKYHVSSIKISTDIIVGFPGETKKQFEDTVKLCKKIGFKKAFVAQYSPRPRTLAEKKFKDNVSQKEKKRRWEIINNLINKTP